VTRLVNHLYELSFRSLYPLTEITFLAHQIEFSEAIAPTELPSKLGRLARRLGREQEVLVLADISKSMVLCRHQLTPDDRFRIQAIESWNLVEPQHNRLLEQLLNQHIGQCFRDWGFRVDEYGKKAMLKRQHRINNSIEAQRFIKWQLRVDADLHIIVGIDYGTAFQDSQTLAQQGLENLYLGQGLVHVYDGKGCRYVEIADYSVADKRPELGNISLLDYHQRNKTVSARLLDAIPPHTKAVVVDYGFSGKPFRAGHIPHLLKRSFSREAIASHVLHSLTWNIHTRFEQAVKRVEVFNASAASHLYGQSLTLCLEPYSPERQVNFAERDRNNLDFGHQCYVSYPVAALKRRQLLDKPEHVSSVVIYPESWHVAGWCDRFHSLCREFSIDLEVGDRTSTPTDTAIQFDGRNFPHNRPRITESAHTACLLLLAVTFSIAALLRVLAPSLATQTELELGKGSDGTSPNGRHSPNLSHLTQSASRQVILPPKPPQIVAQTLSFVGLHLKQPGLNTSIHHHLYSLATSCSTDFSIFFSPWLRARIADSRSTSSIRPMYPSVASSKIFCIGLLVRLDATGNTRTFCSQTLTALTKSSPESLPNR